MSARRDWSLSGRLAWTFGATTSLLLALYGLWSAYVVFDAQRDLLRSFLEHESGELALLLARTDGGREAILATLSDLAELTAEEPCAFRVSNRSGVTLGERGDERLLGSTAPLTGPGDSSGWDLWNDRLVRRAVLVPRHGYLAEVLVDATGHREELQGYLVSSFLAFLVAAALAMLAGRMAAHRGLAGLRQVVAQAAEVDFPSSGSLSVEDAPREVRDVGRALDGMLRRIDAGMESMRTFTAGMAHELRSPLQNLIGETEVALLAEREPQVYRDLLRSNLGELTDLATAVDNLIAFCHSASPSDSGGDRETFDLAEETSLRLARDVRHAAQQGVTLDLQCEGDCRLFADREDCLRLVRNLVTNAVYWTPQGGRVHVVLDGSGADVRLVVQDEGPGVPAELGTRVFEPFVTGRPRSGRRSGYGLGLAICRRVAQDLGGSLTYANGEVGARFEARLPRRMA